MTAKIKIDIRILDQLIKQTSEKVPTFVITDGVEYGIFTEFGTSRMAAQPALVPAIESNVRRLPKVIREALEDGGSLADTLEEFAEDIAGDWSDTVPVRTGALRDSIHVETR